MGVILVDVHREFVEKNRWEEDEVLLPDGLPSRIAQLLLHQLFACMWLWKAGLLGESGEFGSNRCWYC